MCDESDRVAGLEAEIEDALCRGEFLRASALAEELEEISPDRWWPLAMQAVARSFAGNSEQARNLFKRAISVASEDETDHCFEIRTWFSEHYLRQGDLEHCALEAYSDVDKMDAILSEGRRFSLARRYLVMARLHSARGEVDLARSAYADCIRHYRECRPTILWYDWLIAEFASVGHLTPKLFTR